MGIAFVQQKALSAGGTSTFAMTLPGNITSGNTLVLMGGGDQLGQYISAVTGGGVTWTNQQSIANGSTSGNALWTGPNSSGGVNNVSATTNGASYNRKNLNLSEWSGVDTTTPVNSSNSSATNAHPPTVSLTVSGTGDMVIVAGSITGGGSLTTPSSGFTALTSGFSGAAFAYDIISGATGTYSPSWAYSGGSYSHSSVVIVALNAASGGGALAESLTGAAVWSAGLAGKGALAESLTGAAVWSATMTAPSLQLSLTGAAVWSATMTAPSLQLSLTGAAIWSAALAGKGALAESLTGAAVWSATISSVSSIAESLTGAAVWSAALAGSGALAESLTGAASMSATLQGSGALSIVLAGSASWAASTLPPGIMQCVMVGSALWDAVVLAGDGWTDVQVDLTDDWIDVAVDLTDDWIDVAVDLTDYWIRVGGPPIVIVGPPARILTGSGSFLLGRGGYFLRGGS